MTALKAPSVDIVRAPVGVDAMASSKEQYQYLLGLFDMCLRPVAFCPKWEPMRIALHITENRPGALNTVHASDEQTVLYERCPRWCFVIHSFSSVVATSERSHRTTAAICVSPTPTLPFAALRRSSPPAIDGLTC
jgi:hypothetical protein